MLGSFSLSCKRKTKFTVGFYPIYCDIKMRRIRVKTIYSRIIFNKEKHGGYGGSIMVRRDYQYCLWIFI
jgi:hypothetical protein